MRNGGTIHIFHLHNLPSKIQWYWAFNEWAIYGAVIMKTSCSPHRKCTDQIALTFKCSDGGTIHIFYNDNVATFKQLKGKQFSTK